MDPELLLPVGLLITGAVGVVSRRKRTGRTSAPGSSDTTLGQVLDHAGGTFSQWTASALRAAGRLGVDMATKLAAGAGAATSAAAGLVVDGGTASVRSVARPVIRGTTGALSGVGSRRAASSGGAARGSDGRHEHPR